MLNDRVQVLKEQHLHKGSQLMVVALCLKSMFLMIFQLLEGKHLEQSKAKIEEHKDLMPGASLVLV